MQRSAMGWKKRSISKGILKVAAARLGPTFMTSFECWAANCEPPAAFVSDGPPSSGFHCNLLPDTLRVHVPK